MLSCFLSMQSHNHMTKTSINFEEKTLEFFLISTMAIIILSYAWFLFWQKQLSQSKCNFSTSSPTKRKIFNLASFLLLSHYQHGKINLCLN